MRYFYAWTPLAIVGSVVVLSIPWLGLIALAVVAIVVVGALAALVREIVFVLYTLGRAIGHRWNNALELFRHPYAHAAQRRVEGSRPAHAQGTRIEP